MDKIKKDIYSINEAIIQMKMDYYQKFDDQLSALDKQLKDKLIEFESNYLNLICDSNAKIEELKYKLMNYESKIDNLQNELKSKEDDIHDCRSELKILKRQLEENNSITIYCVKKNIREFLENDNYFESRPIQFSNIYWSIVIKSINDDGERYLSYYLRPNNPTDDDNNVEWECDASIELKLLSFSAIKLNETIKFDHVFKSSIGNGCCDFLSYDNLFDSDRCLVQDNSIKLEVNLKINRIERSI